MRPTVSGSPGVAVNLPPGVKESLEADRAASTQQGIALTNTDAGRAQKFALLDDIITQAKVPGAFSGPDQPGFIQTMARLAQVPGVITDDVKRTVGAQEQMTKAMANLQSILMDSMISTNAGLAHTIDASPHPQLSEYGLSGIVHQLQGTYDAQEAMSNAWQNSGRPAYEFKDWQRQFLARTKDGQFDPRVFWLARMNDQERKTFYKASNNDPALKKNYNYAVKNGWIDHESTQ